MVEQLNFNSVQQIDFGTLDNMLPEFQQKREQELQFRAGLETSGAYEEVRRMAATRQEEKSLSNLYTASEKVLTDGVNPSSVANYIQQYRPAITTQDIDVGLEQEAADREVEDAFINNEKTYINNVVDGRDPSEDLAKQEVYTTFLNNLKGWAEDQSLAKKIGGFVRTMFDPQFHQNAVERSYFTNASSFNLKTAEGATEDVSQYILTNWRNMSLKDFSTFLNATYDNIVAQNPNTWMLEEMISNLENGSSNLQEFMGWVDVATLGIAGVTKSFKAAKAAGDASKMRKLAKEAVNRLDKTELVEEMVTTTATKPVQSAVEIAGDAAVADELANTIGGIRAEQILQLARTQGVYDEAELKILAGVERNLMADTFQRMGTDPVDLAVVEDRDGILQTVMLFGAEDGSAMTRQQALNLGERLGYAADEFSVVNKDASGYYVQVIKDANAKVLDARIGTTPDVESFTKDWSVQMSPIFQKTGVESLVNSFARMFAGSTVKSAEAAGRDEVATRVQNAIKKFMERNLKSSFDRLDKQDKVSFKELYLKSQKANNGDGKWYSVDELKDAGFNDKVIKAYADFKTANDMDFLILNEKARKDLVREGYKSYKGIFGKETTIKGLNRNSSRVVDIDGNVIEDVSKYADKGDYKLIQVSRVSANQHDLDCTHILIKAADVPAEELPQFVVRYAPGGRRAYTRGTSFVKVGRTWINPETGTKLNGFAKTLVAGYDKKQLQAYADEVNKALDIYNNAMKGADLNNVGAIIQSSLDLENFKYFKATSWDELKKLIKTKDNPKGLIDPEFRAQVVDEGFSYAYNNGRMNAADSLSEVDKSLQELIDNRARFNRQRTNLLDDINGETVRLMDVEDIYDKVIRKTAAIGAKSELTEWYARNLARFKSVSTNYDSLGGLSAADKINRIEFDTARRARMSTDELRLLRSAQRFVEHAKGILNSKTKADQWLEAGMTRLAQALDITGARGKWFDSVANFKPAKAARALVFNAYMGWWNPAQLIKQSLGITNTIALEPKRGTKALLAYIPIRLARSAEKGSAQYGIYKNLAKKGAGLTDEEFDGLMKFMNKYDVEGSAGLMVGADREYGEALRRDKQLAKKIWDSQYWFMKEGNAANYYMADIAAWLKLNDDVKKGVIKSFTDRDVAAESSKLFLNMTRASESAFQRGTIIPGSEVLAQWMSYPMRMMEAMLGKQLTKAQKARLIGMQISMWGVAGTFGDDETSLNMYRGLVESGIDPEVSEIISDGMLTYLGKQTGVLFDEGIAVKEQFFRLFDIYDATRGEIKWSNISALKAPSYAFGIMKAFDELLNPTLNDRDTYRYLKFLQSRTDVPSAMKNTAKGLLALKTGKFYDKYGDILQRNVTTTQAVFQMLGFRPYESKLENYTYEAMTNRKQVVEDALSEMDEAINVLRYHSIENTKPEEVLRLQEEFNIRFDGILGLIDEVEDGYVKADIISKISQKITEMERTIPDDREYQLNQNFTQHFKNIILRRAEEIRNGFNGQSNN